MKSASRGVLTVVLGILVATTMATADYYCPSNGTDYHHMTGPIISPCRNEIVLQKGQNFTIKCKGKRPLQIRQQDIPEESLGMFYMEERNLTSLDIDNPYEVALNLYNVDQYAVGYYACFDGDVESNAILNDLTEEPTNSKHVTYIYIYVNGTDVIFAPLSEYFIVLNGSKTVLRCRPTMPDTEITLSVVGVTHHFEYDYEKYDPKLGITLYKDDLPDDLVYFECDAWRLYDSTRDVKQFIVKQEVKRRVDMNVYVGSRQFLAGENFTLNCSVKYQPNSAIALSWEIPRNASKESVVNITNECNVSPGQHLYNAITIVNATKEDNGNYTCILSSGLKVKKHKVVQKVFRDEAFIYLTKDNKEDIIETARDRIDLNVEVNAYPPPNFTCYRNDEKLPNNSSKYRTSIEGLTGDFILTIKNLVVNDTANYTILADNGHVTRSVTFDVRKKAIPTVIFGRSDDIIYLENTTHTLLCEAFGYPLPKIDWIFTTDDNKVIEKGEDVKQSEFSVISKLNLLAISSGNITCDATNVIGTTSKTRQIMIYEVYGGFGILDEQEWYSENQKISIRCLASKYKFKNVTWIGPNGAKLEDSVKYTESLFSYIAILKIDQVSLNQNGTYTCAGLNFYEEEEYITTSLDIEAIREPIISEPTIDRDEVVTTYQPVAFSCVADAVPTPTIEWFKDGVLVENNTNGLIIYDQKNFTLINSSIVIERMKDENKGKYECMAISEGISKSRFVNLSMKDVSPFKSTLLAIIGGVVLVLIILVIYLAWKIRKEKRWRKELAAAGLLYFKEGVTNSLNPDLGIDEQAELLPYDEKFEFPYGKLILGKQLGAGAFGVVYKADARGIINAEETTPVAVKMVKKTADNMYIKALASELKIMVHLGKHINIVNLLGACTKNVGKRELVVIVEYCKFGNIHNYIQKHREVFIDQLTDSKEKNLGRVNRGYSCSSASSGLTSDYFGANHTQATDHTFVNTANTSRSGRKDKESQQVEFAKVSETGYVQPEWRSNYESDYSFDGRNPRPLCSRDLLAWSFQIARGMEYLASRKVLHGDLAARNILLAEDNIVKICDFGLARSIYKNDEYQKKENSPLPVKWLAIECMTDRIFSTQSDVWSFGIVLWEMFSLSKTPYPNMSPQHLLQWLSDGQRLEKPTYADDRLYDVMKRCWEHKPTARPTFTYLQELLGSFLEDNVRNHYVDLNSPYMALNAKCEGQEDYLTMVSAPDYKNLVTPSPHHYMNDVTSFFPPSPTEVPLDEEGYLQMTPANQIFSPRSQSTKFDFETKNFDPRDSDAHGGSELTPMLTLNNLPARSGSESDHESGHSPYLKMCPRIVEESDDVFKPYGNNFKHIQNSAVSNPTYITLDVDIEKKPKDINNYVNIPNGLVK